MLYVGPQFFEEAYKFNWIPINPRTMFSKKLCGTRTQFPLRIAYVIKTHKVQGETLASGVICLGKARTNVCSNSKKLRIQIQKNYGFLGTTISLRSATKNSKIRNVTYTCVSKKKKKLTKKFENTLQKYEKLL